MWVPNGSKIFVPGVQSCDLISSGAARSCVSCFMGFIMNSKTMSILVVEFSNAKLRCAVAYSSG